MALKVNFADTKVGDFEAKPNGWYKVAVTDYEMKEAGPNAKNPGSEYINYELTVQEGEYNGAKFWVNASLLPQALFTLKGMMLASGKWTEAQLSSGDIEFEPADLVSCKMEAKNTQREYNGEQRDNIKGFRPYDGKKVTGGASGAVSTAKPSLMP